MKMIKSAVFGSAASLIAMGVAQAADLPLKAKAVQYVKICSLYGAGFYYIPGTDTCIKLGGYARADAVFNGSGVFIRPAWDGNSGQQNRLRNYYITRARENLNIDTRTATEYGVLRTFFEGVFNWTSGNFSETGTGPLGGRTAYAGDGVAGGSLGVWLAFIQFAGFTMGKAYSQFDAPWASYPANIGDYLVGGSGDGHTGVNQFTYTADFGQGITAAISLQDQVAYYQTNIWNTSAATAAGIGTGAYGANDIAGQVAPDIVGMARVDQAWGLFQASLAAHDNHAAYYGATEVTGHPDDKWGWAGQVALSIKNIPTGPGDTVNLSATYANGASRYVFQSLLPTTFAMYSGTSLVGAYQSLAFAGVSDAVFAGGTGLSLTSTYGVRGGFTHNWNPHWNTSIFGAWAHMGYSDTGKALVCAEVSPLLVAGSTCNPDFDIWQIGSKTSWMPVKNLTFSGEVMYTSLDQKYSGAIALPAIGTKPAGLYEFRDQNTWTFGLRAQRNW